MYWLDTAILVVLALAAVLGGRSGFLTQVARLVALGAALAGTLLANARVSAWLQQTLLTDAPGWAARAAAYVAVFVLVYAALVGVAALLERGVKAARLQWLNRTLGALLGSAKAALVLGGVAWGVSVALPELAEEHLKKSILAPPLGEGVKRLAEVIPADYREGLWTRIKPSEEDLELPDVLPRLSKD
jgi:uncharacterized membrane protein required for colicin V production